MAKSPRAENLCKIRDLIVLMVKENITVQKTLEIRAFKEEIFKKKSGEKFKYSRIFHYNDALRFFKFNKIEERGKIEPDEAANYLAKIGKKNYKTERLSDEEKMIFIKKIFSTAYIRDNFIKYFSPEQKPILTYKEFIRVALPIYVTKIYKKKIETIKFKDFCDIKTENGLNYMRIDGMEFLYTLRYWFLKLDLVDQFRVPSQYKAMIEDRDFMIFPIKHKVSRFSIFQAEKIIGNILPYKSMVIPIPIAIYMICRQNFISVENAKKVIKMLFHERPEKYYLNRAPETLIPLKNQNAYIKVDGSWRNELNISSR